MEDICKVRMSKICAGLQVLQGPMTVKLNNLSAMECNVVRPFFQGSLGQFQALAGVQSAEINPIPASLNLDILQSGAACEGTQQSCVLKMCHSCRWVRSGMSEASEL